MIELFYFDVVWAQIKTPKKGEFITYIQWLFK